MTAQKAGRDGIIAPGRIRRSFVQRIIDLFASLLDRTFRIYGVLDLVRSFIDFFPGFFGGTFFAAGNDGSNNGKKAQGHQ